MLPYGIEPYGHTPYGVPYSGTDLSLPDPLVSLDESQYLTYLHYALPYDPNTGTRVPVKLSTDGYASRRNDTLPDSTPASFWYFRPWIINAYNGQNDVMDGNGNLLQPSGGVSQSGTAIQTDIASGVLRVDVSIQAVTLEARSLLRYEWDQAPYMILAGYPNSALSAFSVIFSGVSAAINSYDGSQINITLLDYSYLLQKPLQSQVYMGMNGSLRGDGTTTYGNATFAQPVGPCTLELYVRPKVTASTLRYLAGWKNGTAAGGLYVYFVAGSANRVQVTAIDDVGAVYSTYCAVALLAGYRYGVHCVRDTVHNTLTVYLSLNGNVVSTGSVAISSTFTVAPTAFVTLRAPDAASNYCAADIDEIRLWNIARTELDTISTIASEISVIPANLVAYWRHNEGTGTTAFETISGGGTSKDLAYHGTIVWTGTLEGGADIAGQGAPVWKGINRQVNPVLVDSQNTVYEVSRNEVAMAISDVQDEGNPGYIMDTLSAGQDVYDWASTSYHYCVSYTGGRTLLRVNPVPTGALTVTVMGPVTDTAGIVKSLGSVDGGLASSYFDLTAFALYSARYPESVGIGIRLDTSTTIWSLMQTLAYKHTAWVTVTRTGKITIHKLAEPSLPKYYLDERKVQLGTSIVSRTLAAGKLIYGYKPYNTAQNVGNLATSLTPAQKSDLSQPLRYLPPIVNGSVLAIRPAAMPLTVQSALDSATAAAVDQVAVNALWAINRVVMSLPLVNCSFRYDIGDEIQVTIVCMDGGYVCNLYGVIMVIVGYTIDHKNNAMTLRAWGKEPAMYLVTDSGDIITDDISEGILV